MGERILPPPMSPFQLRNASSDRVGLGWRPFCFLQQEVVAKPPLEVPEVATGRQDSEEANLSDVWPASATMI